MRPRVVLACTLLVLGVAGCKGSDEHAGGRSGAGAGATGATGDLPRYLQYVKAKPYARLALEVDSVPGFAPSTAVESRIVARLERLLDKPDGIRVVRDPSLDNPGNDHGWTLPALRALADERFDTTPRDGEIRIHTMFVNGHYVDPESEGTILGLAWDHTHIAIFKESIDDGCKGMGLLGALDGGACADAQYAIWLHELGHVIGLVDNGIPMVDAHHDSKHPPHDASADCVMYWAYDGTALLARIADTLLPGGAMDLDFDAKCVADVEAAKGEP